MEFFYTLFVDQFIKFRRTPRSFTKTLDYGATEEDSSTAVQLEYFPDVVVIWESIRSKLPQFFRQKAQKTPLISKTTSLLTTNSVFFSLYATFFLTFSHKTVVLKNWRNVHIETVAKLTLGIARKWIETLNGTIELHIHREQGYLNPFTGSSNGLIGQLQKKEADVSGNLIFFYAKTK